MCTTTTATNGEHECGWGVDWNGAVEFEGESGAAEGEMGCADGATVTCEVNPDKVKCTIEEDDGGGDLICDISETKSGDFTAQIECADPVTVGWGMEKVIRVVDGEVVEETVEWIPPLS